MHGYSSRRRWIQLCGTAVLAGLAGCTNDGNGNGSSGDDNEDETGDDADDGAGGSDAEGGTDVENAHQGDLIASSEPVSFAFDVYSRNAPEEGEVYEVSFSGYVTADGDFYYHIEEGSGAMTMKTEFVHVDGTTYFVDETGCQSITVETPPHSPYGGFATYDDFVTQMGGREADGTTTIDGREAYVFEYDYAEELAVAGADQAGLADAPGELSATVYVDVETGYFLGSDYRAVEEGMGEIESSARMHSFGESFTIEPPEGC